MSTVEVTVVSPPQSPITIVAPSTSQITATTPSQPSTVEVVKGIQGAPGTPASAFYHIGPTPPADTSLIWFQTAS